MLWKAIGKLSSLLAPGQGTGWLLLLLSGLRQKACLWALVCPSVKWDRGDMPVGQVSLWPHALALLLLRSLRASLWSFPSEPLCSCVCHPNEHPCLFQTYTGSFAYWVRPVLSEHTLHTLLGRLGYMATSEVEFSLVQAISEEDTKQMVFEIFLTRVACEAVLRTPGRQLLGPGRERVAGPHHRPGSEMGLQEALWEAQPGLDPSAGVGAKSALAEHPDARCSLPVALNQPEVSTAPHGLLTGPLFPLGSLRHASTCSDSEEFLTCYSDLALHRTPLLPWDQPWSSLEGKQLQGPGPGPSPAPGEVAAASGSSGEQPWVPDGASECKGATVPSQLRQRPRSCLSENSLAPKPDALPDPAALGMDTEPPSTSSEMEELCEHFTHLLRTSTPAGYLRDTPSPRVEEEGQSEPLVGPEPASKGGSPDGKVALLWRSPQASTSWTRAPSAYYVPLKGLEEPVPTRRSYTSHS